MTTTIAPPPSPAGSFRAGGGRFLRTAWPWLVLGAAGVASVAGEPAPTAIARLFFMVVLLGAILAAIRRAGRVARVAVALGLAGLLLAQRISPRAVTPPPSSLWIQTLAGPAQAIRHEMRLPVGQPHWERAWQGAASAAFYVCARGPLAPDDGLQLYLNEELVDTITQTHAIGPRPQPTSVGFYRVPVSRQQIERRQPLAVILRRAPGAADRPVEVCGTFSYRPTAGPDSSTFFDGAAWSSAGATRQGRFQIELRIEDGARRALAAIY